MPTPEAERLLAAIAQDPDAVLRAVAAERARLRGLPLNVDDPVDYAVQQLGVELWDRQAEIPRAVARHRKVAVRSGHKVGKTRVAACTALWWAHTKPNGRVVLTSTSSTNLRNVLWREILQLHSRAPRPLGGEAHATPQGGIHWADGREVLGITTDTPERMAGISGPSVLFIVDEASGMAELIMEAIEGNAAGGAHILLLGNPTQLSGTFHDAFHTKADYWHRIHISSEDTPTARGLRQIPGLATREWVEEKRREWGPGNPLWDVRVAGNFPKAGENNVIPLHLVEAAVKRHRDGVTPDGSLYLGVDVARFGSDDTVIQPVRGKVALAKVTMQGANGLQVAAKILQVVRDLRLYNEVPEVRVDAIGVGASVVDQLQRYTEELTPVAVNVAEAATSETYARLRDQLWYAAKEWLAEGGALPPDDKLEAELIAPGYGFDVRGRIKVEGKDEIKAKIGRSPDRADALCLATYHGRPKTTAELWGQVEW